MHGEQELRSCFFLTQKKGEKKWKEADNIILAFPHTFFFYYNRAREPSHRLGIQLNTCIVHLANDFLCQLLLL